jgi:outer membrane lipoprotein-sorting protein
MRAIFYVLIAVLVFDGTGGYGSGWTDTLVSIRAAAGAVSSIRAEFSQEKHLKILSRPLVSTGVLYYQRPLSLRWEYRAPLKSVLLVHAGRARRFVWEGDAFVETAGSGMDAVRFVAEEIPRWLQGRFDDNPNFSVVLQNSTIVLKPTSAALAGMIQRIELQLAKQPGVIDTVTVFEGPDSFTRFTFRDTQLNTDLPETLFTEVR